MLLVGMLDSPYVRRTAIAATLLGVAIDHRSVSVFRHMDAFRAINPLIKAPSFVADDGAVLSDSTLILLHLEDVAGRSLRPVEPVARTRDLALTGVGIVAADKAVALEYERKRPEPQRWAPWIERITSQLETALDLLEEAVRRGDLSAERDLTPADITAAVAWGFCRFVIPDVVGQERWPSLGGMSTACEQQDAFRRWPIDLE